MNKILILHGFGQSTELIEKRGKELFKVLRRDYELYIPEGIYDVTLKVNEENRPGKAWFYYNENDSSDFAEYLNLDKTKWYGIEETITYLIQYIKDNGPFHSIIGFSQGAHLLSYILLSNLLSESQFKNIKCIFIAGFLKPYSIALDLSNLNKLISIPTLHIFGENDIFISKEKSQELVNICENPKIHIHSKGHILAQDSQTKKNIINFLKN